MWFSFAMKSKSEKQPKTAKKNEESSIADVAPILNELKVPLTIIADAVTLLIELQKESPDAKKDELLTAVKGNLDKIGVIVNGLTAGAGSYEGDIHRLIHFDMMNQVQQVCSTHDILFLQKQLHYHISASADLPKVYANPEQILLVLSNLISNAVKYAPRGSDIEIKIKEVSLRQGAGVEVTVVNASEDFTERDRYHIFEKFYKGKDGERGSGSGLGLAICREILQQSHGQLWVDIPAKGRVAFAFVLPCAEIKGAAKQAIHQTFKYDITVANYGALRTKFGPEKSELLLAQVEEYVRKLVRYPVDVVTAFEQSGIISTIYETEEGHASSVATRISQKLGSEHFRIGKEDISITFQYRLSALQ